MTVSAVKDGVIYRRTQIAWATLVSLGLATLVGVSALLSSWKLNGHIVDWILGGVFLVVALLFGTMTVTVTPDLLVVSFGIGVIRKAFATAGIKSYTRVRNSRRHGFGIRKSDEVTVYNASALSSALEFRMSDRSCIRIGSDDLDGFSAAIQHTTHKTESLAEPSSDSPWQLREQLGHLALAALLILGWTVYRGMATVQPSITMGARSFSVRGWLSEDTIQFSGIDEVTLENELPRVWGRQNGFSAFNKLYGTFLIDRWGLSRLYVDPSAPPFVVVREGPMHVVINFSDARRTFALYLVVRRHMCSDIAGGPARASCRNRVSQP